jgi:hypothetical protein
MSGEVGRKVSTITRLPQIHLNYRGGFYREMCEFSCEKVVGVRTTTTVAAKLNKLRLSRLVPASEEAQSTRQKNKTSENCRRSQVELASIVSPGRE